MDQTSQHAILELKTLADSPDVSAEALGNLLGVTSSDIHHSIGISGLEPETGERQRRLSALTRILVQVTSLVEDPRVAYAWYRSQPLPGFGNLTAEGLLKSGRAEAVETHLDRLSDGRFA